MNGKQKRFGDNLDEIWMENKSKSAESKFNNNLE